MSKRARKIVSYAEEGNDEDTLFVPPETKKAPRKKSKNVELPDKAEFPNADLGEEEFAPGKKQGGKGKVKATAGTIRLNPIVPQNVLPELETFYNGELGTLMLDFADVSVPWYNEDALIYFPNFTSYPSAGGPTAPIKSMDAESNRDLWFLDLLDGSRNLGAPVGTELFFSSDQLFEASVPKAREVEGTDKVKLVFRMIHRGGWGFGGTAPSYEYETIKIRVKNNSDISKPLIDKLIENHPYFNKIFEQHDNELVQQRYPLKDDGTIEMKNRKKFILTSNVSLPLLKSKDDQHTVDIGGMWKAIMLMDLVKSTLSARSAIRIFVVENCAVGVYLDLTRLNEFLEAFKTDQTIMSGLIASFNNQLRTQLSKNELPDTLQFPPMIPSEGFKLDLYDYQQRSLRWMTRVEEGEDGAASVKKINTIPLVRFDAYPDKVFRFDTCRFLDKFDDLGIFETIAYTCVGGVLADSPGYGKTVTALALVQTRNLKELKDLKMTAAQKRIRFPSKATIIICPSNLLSQWKSEAIKCLDSKKRIIVIAGIKDHSKLSWLDMIFADLIIVSSNFFSNKQYNDLLTLKYNKPKLSHSPGFVWGEYFSAAMEEIISRRSEQFSKLGEVNLEAFYYHRVIIDEFHEVENADRKLREMLKNFKSDSQWGLTGTPKFQSPTDISLTLDYLDYQTEGMSHADNSKISVSDALSFKDNFIRRNDQDLNLPPIHDTTIWITLTPSELAIYRTRYMIIEQFMSCSHFQICDSIVDVTGDTILDIGEVQNRLCASLLKEVSTLEKKLQTEVKALEEINKQIKETFDDEALEDLKNYKKSQNAAIAKTKIDLNMKSREADYFQRLLIALEKNSLEDTCLICVDEMDVTDRPLGITTCGHVFCIECIKDYVASRAKYGPCKCPKCSSALMPNSIVQYMEKPKEAEKEDVAMAGEDDIDAKYGTKLAVMMKHMKQLKIDNPDYKIIIFSQFRRLAKLIFKLLVDMDISVVRVHSNFAVRNLAVRTFKDDKDCRVIMLSNEDSVSGLHLPEATHMYMVHPFFFGENKELEAIAAEKQGIARAHRLGIKHELQIVRFYTVDTIEESIAKKRT